MRRFAFELALKLGRVNVNRMLDEIDFPHLIEWMAFAELSPFTADRDEYRNANIVQAVVNMNRDTKKRREPWPLEQFVLPFGDMPKYKKRQTPLEQKSIAHMYFRAFSKDAKDVERRGSSSRLSPE